MSTAFLARGPAIAALACVLVLTTVPVASAQEPDDATPPLPTGIPERAEPESPDPGPTGTPLVRDTPGAQAGTRAGSETADWVPYIGSNEIQCTMSNPDPWGVGICSGHHGYTGAMDIAMPVNTVVRAAGPGDVVFVDGSCTPSTCGSAGRWLGIEHPDGKVSRYIHLNTVTVGLGAQVDRGDQIGLSGETGNATLPHTHYDEQKPLYTRSTIGTMSACHGDTRVEYPAVLGHSSWSDVPYGSVLRNDGYGCGQDVAVPEPPTCGATGACFSLDTTNVTGTYTPVSGDFDGDGAGDIFWYRPGGGADYIWYGDRSRSFASAQTQVTGTYTPVSGDFDGDSFSDIFWYGGGDYLWYGTPTGFGGGPGMGLPDGFVTLPGDFDGNGSSDLFWYRAGTGPDGIWFAA